MQKPRQEHPKPQFEREHWMNLNGEWEFEFDFSVSGVEKRFWESDAFSKRILVPFCPESELSGIGFKDFIPAVWYRRVFSLNREQKAGAVLLHFGAVDFECRAYVNGKEAGMHIGGYDSFTFDITDFTKEGENSLAVYARDDTRDLGRPTGKQSGKLESYNCFYTRTTGIWQTVWLEFAPRARIRNFRLLTDPEQGRLTVEAKLTHAGGKLRATARFEGREAGSATANAMGDFVSFTLPLAEKKLWDIQSPHLYDLTLSYETDRELDTVKSYFGLRNICLKEHALHLNGKPVFLRFVLDQGYYPGGVYTAPDDAALIRDIELARSLGFNGARLHEKAFEERFLYHADRLGYLVWGENASWGYDVSTCEHIGHYLPGWLSLVERDFNHPSLIGWAPFNETWDVNGRKQHDDLLRTVYLATKSADPTRPVIDTSGNFHVLTDIYDVHDYEQDPAVFAERYGGLKKGEAHDNHAERQQYGGQPFFVSEYGGTWWSPNEKAGWGYGNEPASEEDFAERYIGLTGALMRAEGVCGFCYTQLYDVEQEQNGLYTYQREEKFSDGIYRRIRAVNSEPAAAENGAGVGAADIEIAS
jgi:beta-galactosidase/beta-glucuronidase